MHDQAMTRPADLTDGPDDSNGVLRRATREIVLARALRKRRDGVPTYSVPEAAALLSVSQEHLYRLIRAGAFPAVAMGIGLERGHYVVPAAAVDEVLSKAIAQPGEASAAATGGAR
jgi:excisionase family DNA binding protein